MTYSAQYLNASEAARRLGVSMKALRLYEQKGLITPVRTTAGWRTYGPAEMARATDIIALRDLGLSLAEVKRVLEGDPQGLEPAFARHQSALERTIRQTAQALEKIRALRQDIAAGIVPSFTDLMGLSHRSGDVRLALDLPWPWGGERFELLDIRPINYIVGPLGCGKTRLSHAIAAALPDAAFLGLDRLENNGSAAKASLDADQSLKERIERALAWLMEEGAVPSDALTALLVGLEAHGPACLVIDMVEDGLDRATQEALTGYLRHHCSQSRPVFLMTRSASILDLDAVTGDEAIIFCPANHSPPSVVAPYPGAPGYEALSTCLASPEVRARSRGVVAFRPHP
ncbi:MerR family transcriptional regulator [Agrobacterium vitis]|uniref:MerR family transcriptional regulator n=1 Tax=Agrobacterium vitis TaxID=373 RepID=UPI003D2867C3